MKASQENSLSCLCTLKMYIHLFDVCHYKVFINKSTITPAQQIKQPNKIIDQFEN